MKRRTFIRNLAVSSILPQAILPLGGCTRSALQASDAGFCFDEIIDRSGTHSIKYGRIEELPERKIPMTIADMDFRTPPCIMDALRKRLERDVLGYTMTPDAYAESIMRWVRLETGWDIQKEWISYCPGVITSLCQAIECFSVAGDKVIVQPPVYNPFMDFTRKLGREVVYNPLIFKDGSYCMDFDQLEHVIDEKTRILILCNPHNPGGMTWDMDSLRRLADICFRHGILVISDEIHCDLVLWGKRHIPFCSVSPQAASCGIILTGPTKTFNLAGLGGAQSYIPDPALRERFLAHLDSRKLLEPSIITMELTMAGYSQGLPWLEALREYIGDNVAYAMDTISREMPAICVTRPGASFLLWLDCRSLGLDSDSLRSLFQDRAGVMVNMGGGYGPGGEGFIRMNIGCPRSVLMEALQRIAHAVKA